MVEFKKYDGASAELTDLGTVKALAGKGGTIAFLRKNYNDTTKRVALVVGKKDGTSAVVSCSKQVSDAIRGGKLNIKQIAGLNIVENKEGVAFISMPATGAVQTVQLDKVNVQAFATEEADFLPEELVAL